MQDSSTKTTGGKVAIIDGDILLYRCGFAAEHTHYLVQTTFPSGYHEFDNAKAANAFMKENGLCTRWERRTIEPEENALQALRLTIESIKNKINPSSVEIYVSGWQSYRNAVAVTREYKGNRDERGKPKHYNVLRDYLIDFCGAKVARRGYEADDELGIRLTELGQSGVIVSIDKDLDQIAGWHYNWVEDQWYEISRRDAAINFYSQILSGDPTDNVPGLAGYGPATARKILEDSLDGRDAFAKVWDRYKSLHGAKKGWTYLLEQGQLVHIRRHDDGIPWSPPFVPEDSV